MFLPANPILYTIIMGSAPNKSASHYIFQETGRPFMVIHPFLTHSLVIYLHNSGCSLADDLLFNELHASCCLQHPVFALSYTKNPKSARSNLQKTPYPICATTLFLFRPLRSGFLTNATPLLNAPSSLGSLATALAARLFPTSNFLSTLLHEVVSKSLAIPSISEVRSSFPFLLLASATSTSPDALCSLLAVSSSLFSLLGCFSTPLSFPSVQAFSSECCASVIEFCALLRPESSSLILSASRLFILISLSLGPPDTKFGVFGVRVLASAEWSRLISPSSLSWLPTAERGCCTGRAEGL